MGGCGLDADIMIVVVSMVKLDFGGLHGVIVDRVS